MKNLIVIQEEIADCGVCSLLSIIKYYKGNVNIEELRIDSNTSSKGVTAYDLIECAKKNGFYSKGIKKNKIEKEDLPCIAHFKIGNSLTHFVVLYKIENNNYTIMDPSKGIIKLTEEEFNKHFTSFIIILKPKTKLPYKENKDIVKYQIKKEIQTNKKEFIKNIILNIILCLLTIISGLYINIYKHENKILILSIIFIIITTTIHIINFKISNKNIKIENNIKKGLLLNFYKKTTNLPLKYLYIKDPNEILKREEEIQIIANSISNIILNISINLFILIISAIIILTIKVQILIQIIIPSIFIIFFSFIKNKILIKTMNEVVNINTTYNNGIIEMISSLISINHSKCSNMANKMILEKLDNKIDIETKYYKNINTKEQISSYTLEITKLIISIYLIKLIINKTIELTTYLYIIFIIEIYLNSLKIILSYIPDIILIKKYKTKINNYYNYNEMDKNYLNEKINGNIEINNLSFKYNIKNVINNLNLNIKSNEKIIIKGISGCGKSTLAKILTKELDNYKGKILINNIELSKISQESINKSISCSGQSEKIFSGTIKQNILLGKNITDKNFERIINTCCLNKLINKKYFKEDTFLIGGGEEISGGERQLILLARILALDTDIIILDETLSEVDNNTEQQILKNLKENYIKKTIIYITHNHTKNYNWKTIYI